MDTQDRACVTVDMDALRWNYRFLRQRCPRTTMAAVVKANAYGLGLVPVAAALAEAECHTFFVATLDEAFTLRQSQKDATIYVLHGVSDRSIPDACAARLTPIINHLGALEAWQRHAAALETVLPAMIHLDTGMNRLGLDRKEYETLRDHADDHLRGLNLIGWMSHFSSSDIAESDATSRQKSLFETMTRTLPPAPRSLSNSAGLFWGEDYPMEIARPGRALYGINPTPNATNPMRPVVELTAPILQIRDTQATAPVGYAETYRARRSMRIATIACGYADGYTRALSNRGHVLIAGYKAPIVGRISMDLLTCDVTDIPDTLVHSGARAVLFGQGRSIEALADDADTIGHAILTTLGPRIVRHYTGA